MSKTFILTFTSHHSLMLHRGRTVFCGSTSGTLPHPLLPLLWNKLLMIGPFCTGALRLKSQIFQWCSWCMLSSRGFIFSYASSYVCDLSIRINSKMLPMWRAATFRLNFKESVNGCQSSDFCSFCSAVHLFIHTCSKVRRFMEKYFASSLCIYTRASVFLALPM